MHDLSHLGPKKVFIFGDGSFFITETVVWGVIVALVIGILACWSASKLQRVPKGKQVIAEFVVEKAYSMVQSVMGVKLGTVFAPYMASIFFFMLLSNLLGLFGFRPVTSDLNCTFALAITTFFLIQGTGVKFMGVGGKLKHMCSPYPFMIIINLIEMFSTPLSLGLRLFGNILAGMIVMSLVYSGLATLSLQFVGIPILDAIFPLPANAFFDMFEPVLQAYIFTMLTMAFMANEAITLSDHIEEQQQGGYYHDRNYTGSFCTGIIRTWCRSGNDLRYWYRYWTGLCSW